MLYAYPDNFIVPVIFVDNFINKETIEKKNKRLMFEEQIEKMEGVIRSNKQEKFRNNDKNEFYKKLQEKFVMEWESEGEYSQNIDDKKIFIKIDDDYSDYETEGI